ncbi:MAG: hypothetical protein JXB45_12585 [Candidatus Krumholzibacteriota bacterium]|nr:hypothetical protein [Candidatus Krumholzibacteriota bacterium]
MGKCITVFLAVILISSSAWAQMEKGDKEVRASGMIYTAESFSMITLMGVYGKFIEENIQVGAGPSLSYFKVGDYDDTTLGAAFFGRYYFTLQEKRVPYLSGELYQADFSPPEGTDFTDYTSLQLGGGLKYFLNEYVAWDVSANLGFRFGGGVSLMIVGGLSAFF